MHIRVEFDKFNVGIVFTLQSEFVWYTFMETYLWVYKHTFVNNQMYDKIEFGVPEMGENPMVWYENALSVLFL